MKKHYLPFEKPLKDLDIEIEKLISNDPESENIKILDDKRTCLLYTSPSPRDLH